MKVIRVILILLSATLLVLIRIYEADLFYDPLIKFFATNHSTQPLPEFNLGELLLNTTLRFVVNTALSLAVLWLVFKKQSVLKVSTVLYGGLFVLVFTAFVILLNTSEAGNHLLLFYVRRFLIQPIFLLILLPAFYFQHKK